MIIIRGHRTSLRAIPCHLLCGLVTADQLRQALCHLKEPQLGFMFGTWLAAF